MSKEGERLQAEIEARMGFGIGDVFRLDLERRLCEACRTHFGARTCRKCVTVLCIPCEEVHACKRRKL